MLLLWSCVAWSYQIFKISIDISFFKQYLLSFFLVRDISINRYVKITKSYMFPGIAAVLLTINAKQIHTPTTHIHSITWCYFDLNTIKFNGQYKRCEVIKLQWSLIFQTHGDVGYVWWGRPVLSQTWILLIAWNMFDDVRKIRLELVHLVSL